MYSIWWDDGIISFISNMAWKLWTSLFLLYELLEQDSEMNTQCFLVSYAHVVIVFLEMFIADTEIGS